MSEFADIAEVAKLRRIRAVAVKARQKKRADPGPPGTLFEFMVRVSCLVAPLHLAPIVAWLARIPFERIELCFSAPPRMGKSTLLRHLVAWLLILNPKWKIAWVSYGAEFAEENVAAIKQIYIAAGGALGEKQTEAVWTTRAGGVVRGCGLDGPLTGRGFDLVICDDAHKNLEQALSRTIREGVVKGYNANVWSRKTPRVASAIGTSFLVSHTRWFETDLVGSLTDPTNGHPWPLENLPAIREDGTALAPDFFTLEDIQREREQLGEFVFAALHMGSPRPVGGLLFGDVATIDALEPGGTWRYTIGIDIAFSARTRADFNVACVMRRNVATGEIDVVEVVRQQGTLADRVSGRGDEPEWSEGFLRTLHGLTKRYPGAPVVMHVSKSETLVVALAARHDKFPVRIRATLATSEKWVRSQRYAAAWGGRDGKLRVLSGTTWFAEFVREHVNFTGDPKGGRDDQVDAATSAYEALVGHGAAMAPRGTGQGSEASRIARNVAV